MLKENKEFSSTSSLNEPKMNELTEEFHTFCGADVCVDFHATKGTPLS